MLNTTAEVARYNGPNSSPGGGLVVGSFAFFIKPSRPGEVALSYVSPGGARRSTVVEIGWPSSYDDFILKLSAATAAMKTFFNASPEAGYVTHYVTMDAVPGGLTVQYHVTLHAQQLVSFDFTRPVEGATNLYTTSVVAAGGALKFDDPVLGSNTINISLMSGGSGFPYPFRYNASGAFDLVALKSAMIAGAQAANSGQGYTFVVKPAIGFRDVTRLDQELMNFNGRPATWNMTPVQLFSIAMSTPTPAEPDTPVVAPGPAPIVIPAPPTPPTVVVPPATTVPVDDGATRALLASLATSVATVNAKLDASMVVLNRLANQQPIFDAMNVLNTNIAITNGSVSAVGDYVVTANLPPERRIAETFAVSAMSSLLFSR